jgi:hypothetical protein
MVRSYFFSSGACLFSCDFVLAAADADRRDDPRRSARGPSSHAAVTDL